MNGYVASVAAVRSFAMDLLAKAKADVSRLDEVIRRAQETMERAQREKEEIATFIRVHERYARGDAAAAPAGAPSGSKTDVVRAHTREILASASRRMVIQEIYDALLDRGVAVSGQQPKANLAGILSRDGEHFTYSKADGGWWLVGMPEPEAEARAAESAPSDATTENEGTDEQAPSEEEAPHGDAGGASDPNPPQFSFQAGAAA